MDLRRLELHSDYDAIEEYVRLARLERSAALGQWIGRVIAGATDACKALAARIAAAQPGARQAAAIFARTAGH